MPQTYPFSGIVYDTDGTTALENVRVTAVNLTTGEELPSAAESITNSSGEYTIDAGNFDTGFSDGDVIEVYAYIASKDASYTHTIDTGIGAHSEDMTLSVAVTYTTPSKVSRFLGIDNFSSSSIVSQRAVNEIIKRMEDQIDDITGHAWRTKTVTNEFHNIEFDHKYHMGVPVYLKHRMVKNLSTGSGDKLEVWDGTSYEDWTANKTEGRGDDFWLDYDKGILYLVSYFFRKVEKGVRITYRYGESTVPKDIEDACTKLVAIDVLISDDRSVKLPEGLDGVDYLSKIRLWQKQIDEILHRRKEIRGIWQ